MSYRNHRASYDVIVHPTAGVGDYDELTTANFTAMGAGARIFITGDYTITSSFDFADDQTIYWDDVTLTLNGCRAEIPASVTTGARWEGKLTLGGTGEPSPGDYNLLNVSGTAINIDAGNCKIYLNPNYAGAHADDHITMLFLYSSYSNWDVYAHDITANITGKIFGIVGTGGSGSHFKINFKNITSTNATQGRGVATAGSANVYEVYMDTLTDDTGNVFQGLRLDSNNDVALGSITNCDQVNLDDNGANNKTGELYAP